MFFKCQIQSGCLNLKLPVHPKLYLHFKIFLINLYKISTMNYVATCIAVSFLAISISLLKVIERNFYTYF